MINNNFKEKLYSNITKEAAIKKLDEIVNDENIEDILEKLNTCREFKKIKENK